MQAPCDATLLRIYLGDDDVFHDQPLSDQLVLKARELHLAGATVLHGILAYGPATRDYKPMLKLTEDRPMVIDIVDTRENISRFLQAIEPMLGSALVTTQEISVLRYGARS